MTRAIVYSSVLLASAAATAMTIAANLLPHWVDYSTGAGGLRPFWQTLGLHQLCSSEAQPHCRPFPTGGDCPTLTTFAFAPAPPFGAPYAAPSSSTAFSSHFCSLWRSVRFLQSLSLVAELAALVGFVVVLAGGRLQRTHGWPVLGTVLAAVAALQLAALALVAYLLDHDDRFLVPGWRLGASWVLCAVSASVAVLGGFGLALSAVVLPPEDGYECLREPPT